MFSLPPETSPASPVTLGGHRAAGLPPCAIPQLPTSCLFYTRSCIYVNAMHRFIPLTLSPSVSTSSQLYVFSLSKHIPPLSLKNSTILYHGETAILYGKQLI